MYELTVTVPTLILCILSLVYVKDKYDQHQAVKNTKESLKTLAMTWSGVALVAAFTLKQDEYQQRLISTLNAIASKQKP
jgi:hypothetical protein